MLPNLIEISRASLFYEYLIHLQIKAPDLGRPWCLMRGSRIIACIQCDPGGRPRFFIDGAMTRVNALG